MQKKRGKMEVAKDIEVTHQELSGRRLEVEE
jgi:hypothetical protein